MYISPPGINEVQTYRKPNPLQQLYYNETNHLHEPTLDVQPGGVTPQSVPEGATIYFLLASLIALRLLRFKLFNRRKTAGR